MNRRALPPFVSEDVAKATGQVRLYYRRPGQRKIRIWLAVEREGFWPAYEAAKKGIQLPKPENAPKRRAPIGRTFETLCHDYYRSADFLQLASVSQRNRKGILKHCCDEETKAGSGLRIGNTPLEEFGPDHVKALRDRKGAFPEAANNRIKALRGLFKWHLKGKRGVENPCEGFGKLKPKNADGFHAWTMQEVARFEAHHLVGSNARLAFDLALYTAQRRSDVVRLGPKHVTIRDGIAWLVFQQEKTRRTGSGKVEIPIITPLALSIAARPHAALFPDEDTFLMTSYGKPFTANGLGNAFREWCDEAKLFNCSMHGLRKATASRFAELGVNEDGIGAVLGHAPGSKQLAIYTKSARRRLMAESAMKKLQESLPKQARIGGEKQPGSDIQLSHLENRAPKNGAFTEEKSS